MKPFEERLKNLEEAVATQGYILARLLPYWEGAQLSNANKMFIGEARRLAAEMKNGLDQTQSSTIRAAEFSLVLDEIIDLCERDPLYAIMLRPQLEKLGEALCVTSDKPS